MVSLLRIATVVPEAVTGTKDEVATADDDAIGQKKGDPIHQGMDYAKITPLLKKLYKRQSQRLKL